MKSRRQVAIKDILFNQRIATQDEILSALRARGYNVTQATVSRDIRNWD
jgi:transcriptional regulator of arginine metabolism